ncbi:capsid protein [Fusarium poae victorivirus 1]|uniref:Capsid protein n=1 Tax=Fusarium poae victorivirus 1 TaxID=1849535 RepID=A0A1B4ZA53_9VIRU|nr:capsid protein [Fusarium poae victorivirus 1]BAV56301.1 capsid protein [Fusarium poae victorivirus 1]
MPLSSPVFSSPAGRVPLIRPIELKRPINALFYNSGAMAQPQSFRTATTSALTGAVAGVSSGQIQDDNTYRRYRSGLSIGVHEHGHYAYKRSSVFYEVGRRYARLTQALAGRPEGGRAGFDASVMVNPAEAANFEGWARRFSNFSPAWDMMDLAGVVERLAKAVAAQSVYGGVSTTNMRAGFPVSVVALGTLDSPQTASSSSVFIPRTVDRVGNDNVFAVLAAAANGEGATVTTDVVRLDAATNQPVVPAVQGQALAQAAVEGLRILGANFERSGAGDIFAYALTRGIHSVVSVVSHTDEGGWLRGVLRRTGFRAPYGGINQDLRDYPQLPPLASLSTAATSAWVDAIALKTAAIVAHCDPCVRADGGYYPSVFTASSGDISPPGTEEGEVPEAVATNIGRQISSDVGRFAPLYMRGLCYLFGMSSTSGIAEAHFSTTAADHLSGTTDRHLRHRTVAPYFWIEPTSLVPTNALGTTAEAAGFGALTTAGVEAAIPAFERVREIDHGHNANFTTIGFKMRSARTSGLVAAYAANPAELSGLRLYQFDESSVVLAGNNGPTNGDVPAKHNAADPLSSYLWTRGQSAIPAPAEFMNIQGSYAAKYKVVDWDDDFNGTLGPLPEAWELESHPTKWRTSVPTALPAGASNYADSGARRARSRAGVALAQATLRNRGLGDANSPVISVSNVPPSWDDERPATTRLDDTRTAEHNPAPGVVVTPGQGTDTADTPAHLAAPALPIPHQQPLRGAPYPPRAPGQLGGAQPPPPPVGPPAPPGPPGGPPNDDDNQGPPPQAPPADNHPVPPAA